MAVFKMENRFVPVSTDFINKYMPEAHGEYVKVYLYGLAAAAEGREADNESVAKLLRILVADVENAWKYWSERGLVRLEDGNVTFVSGEPFSGHQRPDPVPGKNEAADQSYDENRPPHISSRDVARALELNSGMKDTITMAEQLLEKPLSPREITCIYNFMDWYGMDGELVLMLLEYCIAQGKKNFSYIEKVAQGWSRDGIDDIKKADVLIKRANSEKKFQGQCRKIFGLDRAFTASELKYINSWRTELGFSPDMVARAYDITINNTGKLALPYMNKIMLSWHQKGVKRPADIKEKDQKPAADTGGRKMDEQAILEMRRRLNKNENK